MEIMQEQEGERQSNQLAFGGGGTNSVRLAE